MTRRQVLVPNSAEVESRPGNDASPADIWAYSQQLRFARVGRDKWADLFSEDGVQTYPFAAPEFPRRVEGRAEVSRVVKGVADSLPVTACPAECNYVIHQTSDSEVIVVEATDVVEGQGADAAYPNNLLHVLRVRRGEVMLFADYGSSRSMAWSASRSPGALYDENQLARRRDARHESVTTQPGDLVSSWPDIRPGPRATAREMWQYGIYLHTSHELIGSYASLFAVDGIIEFPFLPSGYPTPDFPNRIHGRADIQRVLIPRLLSNHKVIRMCGLRSIVVHDVPNPALTIVEFEGVYEVIGTGEIYSRPQVQIKRVRDGEFVHVRDYFSISRGSNSQHSSVAPR